MQPFDSNPERSRIRPLPGSGVESLDRFSVNNPNTPVDLNTGGRNFLIDSAERTRQQLLQEERDRVAAGARRDQNIAPFRMSDKIKIVEYGQARNAVIFDATPEVSEAKNTNYIEIADIREPASILIFISSPGRTFNVNAKLVSRTPQEAQLNFERLHLMKSWAMPDKGSGTTYNAIDLQGNVVDSDVPRILQLFGYGANIKGIPIVMKSINVEYTIETDYISTSSGNAKMPIICPVNMSFQEIRSAEDMAQFNIIDYKQGILQNW